MKTALRNLCLLFVFFTTSMALGAVPFMNVTVSRSNDEVVFTGTTDASGSFATPSLRPGHYVVQLRSTSEAVKKSNYALVISAGSKKVSATAVSGEMFSGGGVAMRVDVEAGLNITGHIASVTTDANGNFKPLVWIPTMPGSTTPGHWAEKGSAEEVLSRTRRTIPRSSLVKLQDHNDRGNAGDVDKTGH
jgi:hypothetical protein